MSVPLQTQPVPILCGFGGGQGKPGGALHTIFDLISPATAPAKGSISRDRREDWIGPTPHNVTDDAMGPPKIRFDGRAMAKWSVRCGKRRLPILKYTLNQPRRRVCPRADLFIINRSIE